MHAQADGEAVINLFVAGTARFHLNGTTVVLTQRGAHPRDEEVVVEVDPATPAEFTLSLRVPEQPAGQMP